MTIDITKYFVNKSQVFEDEAHGILSIYENSRSRVVLADQTRGRLKILSLLQNELFEQALVCTEKGINRAAHVMAWAAFMDFLENKISSDGLVKLKLIKTGWVKFKSIEEIRENVPEYQMIEAARDMGLLSKNETKTILGLLSKRNECAHPSGYDPNMNESLGFISELINRIEKLNTKSI